MPSLRAGFAVLLALLCLHAALAQSPYDLDAIRQDPLDAEVVTREVADGIVTETVVFNGDRDRDGEFIRITGIVAYPKGGENLPAILWCMGGMGDARPHFPQLFARKGYMAIHITLAKDYWGAHGKFDTENPTQGNFVRLAWEQMRAVTYLANRPEVDADRLGVGGASYGGVFATLVAGIDPRIKAGMSFFGAGNHRLGTNLPQFTALESLDEIATFEANADGATFMKQREIPFLWATPTNDNWFYLPAVLETYRQKPGAKRLAIVPHWIHGFPPNVDQQLFDWFDIYLAGTRAPYLDPSAITLTQQDGTLMASWSWSGEPSAQTATLVVSYGAVIPWHGWRHRHYHSISASIDGQTATAEIPVPDPDLPMLVFGSVTDEHDVLISTVPVLTTARELGLTTATGRPVTDGYPHGAFEAENITILQGTAQGFGQPDGTVAHGGSQSVLLDGEYEAARRRKPKHEVDLHLFNVYGQAHQLRVWLRADRQLTVDLAVTGRYPANWDRPAVRAILPTIPGALPVPAKTDMPVHATQVTLGTHWQEVVIPVPAPTVAIEGYALTIDRHDGAPGKYWIDDVSFQVVWPD